MLKNTGETNMTIKIFYVQDIEDKKNLTDLQDKIRYDLRLGAKPKISEMHNTHFKVYEYNEDNKFYDEGIILNDEKPEPSVADITSILWCRFNSETNNPLSYDTDYGSVYQKAIQQGLIPVAHTSMSVGDIIQINDRYYVCARIGWEELQ